MGTDLGASLDLIWKLLLVLGLAVIAMRGLRWLSAPSAGPNSPVRLLARLPLSPQQTIVLLAVGSRRLLIGQSPQQLTVLAELAEDDLNGVLPVASGGPSPDRRHHMSRSLTTMTVADLFTPWQQRLGQLLSSRGQSRLGPSSPGVGDRGGESTPTGDALDVIVQ